MRVVGGKYRGRNLVSVSGKSVRPTSDRIKESIFNLIQDYTNGADVLDLFAGSGALGIEALSRGAKSAVFSDISRNACETVRSNLHFAKEPYEIFNRDYSDTIRGLSGKAKKFDIIFLDPPYNQGAESRALAEIEEYDILNSEGIIVLERDKYDKPYALPKPFAEIDKRSYGNTDIAIIKRATKVAITGTFDPFTKGHMYLVEQALEKFDIIHIALLINPDKTAEIGIDKRLELIRKAVKKHKSRVRIEFFEGMAIDYCRQNGIEYIIRGSRSPEDFAYETQMAEYNYQHGGVTTIIIPAKDEHISSTAVRAVLAEGGTPKGLVDDTIIKDLLKEGRKWKT
ncbi:MAG: 16S rRNA (guanine(966)-N(2))-methyltransferase RsmD [Clostridia bacterium]